MTRRIDPGEAQVAVERLRRANPVRGTVERQSSDQVVAFLLQVMERTDVVQDITKKAGSSERATRKVPAWVGLAAGFALAGLLATPLLLINRGSGDPALEGLSAAQARVVADLVEAINTEDFEGFRALFAEEGAVAFETGLVRPYHEGVSSGQPIPMTDVTGFEADFAWGAIIDRRITPKHCESESELVFRCEINSQELAHRVEWLETLGMSLDEDHGITLLFTEPLDVDPVDREQPLSLSEYMDDFDRWLQETHPDEHQRLVRPGTHGEINGAETPLDPSLLDELTGLIDEYIANR